MSRVDEALRRAAEAAREKTGVAALTSLPTAVETDPAEFPKESCPIETPEAFHAQSIVAAVVTLPAVEPPELDLKLDAAEPVTESIEAPPSLFERLDAKLAAKIVIDRTMMPASREQYRRLASSLHRQQQETGLKVVMIASAVVGEGKTLTASNLALTLSESYQRSVILIDADLRRPSLNVIFGTNGSLGLSEGLTSVEEKPLALQQVSSRLAVLPAGKASSDPMAGLTSPRMRRVIEEARRQFDWVIIDTPPVGLLTDANLLASMVDGTLLVVHAGSTPYDLVKRAIEALGASHVLGVVLNRASTEAQSSGYGYDYYSHYHPDTVAGSLQ
jgi:capsular exopolysaccharide synthesis family protein